MVEPEHVNKQTKKQDKHMNKANQDKISVGEFYMDGSPSGTWSLIAISTASQKGKTKRRKEKTEINKPPKLYRQIPRIHIVNYIFREKTLPDDCK